MKDLLRISHLTLVLSACWLVSLPARSQNVELDSLRKALAGQLNDSVKLVYLDQLATSFLMQDEDSARKYLQLQKELALRANQSRMLARAYSNYGNFFKDKLFNNDSAKAYFQRALDIETALGNDQGIADMYHLLGVAFAKEGNSEMALSYYLKALPIKESLGDHVATSNTVTSIGFIYNNVGMYRKALEHFQRALELLDTAGVPYNRKRGAYNNVGLAYMRLKDYDEARRYYRMSVKDLKETDNLRGYGIFYNNMGVTYDENFQFDSAHYYYTQSLRVKTMSGDLYGISSTNHNIAVNYRRANRPAEAIPFERVSKKIAEENKFLEFAMKTANGLRESYEALHMADSAYHYSLVWKMLSDSLARIERNAAVIEMEVRYASQMKDKELALQKADIQQKEALLKSEQQLRAILIAGMAAIVLFAVYIFRSERVKSKANKLLERKGREIEEQSRLIAASLHEKEALLKEIHHRVKNNLQVISSILNMQSRNTSNPDMLTAIQEGQSRVKAMALIHQKLYQSDKLSEIDFGEYAEELIEHISSLFASNGSKGVSRNISSDVKLDIDVAIPLGLILNELISNAYKYAFDGREAGEITVELKRLNEERLQLEVADNGAGLPPEFTLEKTKSLGLKLVNILTRQLNGTLDIKNEHGTRFSITFSDLRLLASSNPIQ